MFVVFWHLKSYQTLRWHQIPWAEEAGGIYWSWGYYSCPIKGKCFKQLGHWKNKTTGFSVIADIHFQTGHLLWGNIAEKSCTSDGNLWSEWPVWDISHSSLHSWDLSWVNIHPHVPPHLEVLILWCYGFGSSFLPWCFPRKACSYVELCHIDCVFFLLRGNGSVWTQVLILAKAGDLPLEIYP
jgi:hypothetical protein